MNTILLQKKIAGCSSILQSRGSKFACNHFGFFLFPSYKCAPPAGPNTWFLKGAHLCAVFGRRCPQNPSTHPGAPAPAVAERRHAGGPGGQRADRRLRGDLHRVPPPPTIMPMWRQLPRRRGQVPLSEVFAVAVELTVPGGGGRTLEELRRWLNWRN